MDVFGCVCVFLDNVFPRCYFFLKLKTHTHRLFTLCRSSIPCCTATPLNASFRQSAANVNSRRLRIIHLVLLGPLLCLKLQKISFYRTRFENGTNLRPFTFDSFWNFNQSSIFHYIFSKKFLATFDCNTFQHTKRRLPNIWKGEGKHNQQHRKKSLNKTENECFWW